MREKYLREMLLSMLIGGLMAFGLCLIIPEHSKLAMFVGFVVYWVVGMFTVWTVIDVVERLKGE